VTEVSWKGFALENFLRSPMLPVNMEWGHDTDKLVGLLMLRTYQMAMQSL